MKHLRLLLFLAFSTTVLISCGSDDNGSDSNDDSSDDDGQTTSLIVGTWEATDVAGSGVRTRNVNGTDIEDMMIITDLDLDFELTFDDATDTATTDISFLNLFFEIILGDGGEDSGNRNFSFPSGDYNEIDSTLTIGSGTSAVIFQINSLTATELVLTTVYDENVDGDQEVYGIDYTFTKM